MAKAKNKALTEEEIAVFRDAVRGTQPLKQTERIEKPTRTINVRPKRRAPDEEKEDLFAFSDYEKLASVSSDDSISYARDGLQHKMLRKLHQGQYNVEAALDLHGKTVEEARESLSEFLHQCQQRGFRHVLIIHGKGRGNTKPILKNKLNHWLRQTGQVIAFCSAQAKDGRSGALYVLLRR